MTPSTFKILARFGGNRAEAVAYCEKIAHDYPRLSIEYKKYAEVLNSAQIQLEAQ